ncbi:hypothetical protein CAI21_17630 [Alkalilimnicola ehrlichii]|uniref:DUF3301 domain-containing protein n=1 Tax=Alkalilimnicola ehrlichii TaxID=351052 RepID=A0A3E0WJF9_9GAMM|nr:DUF3301 domain-containing protein [Alkalilimnicola ehrlichii]RFA26151.1 hypothetical protein CAI21_17630 [Alkalilimnicola ehrlichii]RFA32353.1 hypothetical protein CAL65_19910 [Alkalilimnicola ehrlichii]
MTTLSLLILAVAAAAFWYDSLGARERALAVCRQACRKTQVQLLDQTVSVAALGLSRHGNGRLQFDRRYRFEFSLQGHDRHTGWLKLRGRRVEWIQLEHPEGLIIMDQRY